MKVFISWSGERSKAVAELLREWIKCVLQASKPWISTRNVDRGSHWFSEINDQLKGTAIGIVCLIQDNKEKPRIFFEAGALAKASGFDDIGYFDAPGTGVCEDEYPDADDAAVV